MSQLTKYLFFIIDIIILNIAILMGAKFGNSTWQDTVYLLLYSNLSWFFLALVSSAYRITRLWAINKIVSHQIAFLFVQLLVTGSLVVFFEKHYDLKQLLLAYLTFGLFYFLYRVGYFYVRNLVIKKRPEKRFVIVGKNDLAYNIRKYYNTHPELGYQFVGYLNFDYRDQNITAMITEFCRINRVNEIISCSHNADSPVMKEIIKFGLNSLIKVRVVFNPSVDSELVGSQKHEIPPVENIHYVPLDKPLNRVVKRMFDLLFSMMVLVFLLSWIIPLFGLLIWIDSKGPIFFVQQRNGEGNRPFGCLKFRTMVVNQDADTVVAKTNDHRVTLLGKFLRKSSIDELPQFLNVIMGEMSVIGPRPHMVSMNERLSFFISEFSSRHYIKPGITGLAQCMGYRGGDSIEHMQGRLRLDRYYIENWSFWLDIKIIFLTVISLLRGSDKAY